VVFRSSAPVAYNIGPPTSRPTAVLLTHPTALWAPGSCLAPGICMRASVHQTYLRLFHHAAAIRRLAIVSMLAASGRAPVP